METEKERPDSHASPDFVKELESVQRVISDPLSSEAGRRELEERWNQDLGQPQRPPLPFGTQDSQVSPPTVQPVEFAPQAGAGSGHALQGNAQGSGSQQTQALVPVGTKRTLASLSQDLEMGSWNVNQMFSASTRSLHPVFPATAAYRPTWTLPTGPEATGTLSMWQDGGCAKQVMSPCFVEIPLPAEEVLPFQAWNWAS